MENIEMHFTRLQVAIELKLQIDKYDSILQKSEKLERSEIAKMQNIRKNVLKAILKEDPLVRKILENYCPLEMNQQ